VLVDHIHSSLIAISIVTILIYFLLPWPSEPSLPSTQILINVVPLLSGNHILTSVSCTLVRSIRTALNEFVRDYLDLLDMIRLGLRFVVVVVIGGRIEIFRLILTLVVSWKFRYVRDGEFCRADRRDYHPPFV
jgi:hypothetical protein